MALSFSGASDGKTWRVTEVRSDGVVWENESGGWELRTFNPFLPARHARGPNGDVSQTITGDPLALFPLQRGKAFAYRISGNNALENKKWEYTRTCTVGDDGRAQVPAGAFPIIRVECNNENGGAEIYEYAPQIGYWVRWQRTRQVTELSGYKLAP
jgi:hypothetical protein